jgi:tRNA U34 5-carboxymethylaminomethyl modifying enzyme MnmG/GidA
MNLEKQAGLFFITELEKHAEPGIIPQIREIGVDLELMQIEHHQLYRTKTTDFNNSNNDESEQKSPSELDEKNNTTFPNPTQNEIKLLELLQQKDIDSIEARSSLRISKEELDDMIVNLLNAEYLHYISNDEVKLTNKAITFLAQKNNKQFV